MNKKLKIRDLTLRDGQQSLFATRMTGEQINQVIDIYNNKRPHLSLDYATPNQAYVMKGEQRRKWKNYYKSQSPEKDEEIILSLTTDVRTNHLVSGL